MFEVSSFPVVDEVLTPREASFLCLSALIKAFPHFGCLYVDEQALAFLLYKAGYNNKNSETVYRRKHENQGNHCSRRKR
ncbi:Uncharacterised protein [Bacillus freudenreichii]|nr:Uncharacterised protein [Bacillus freudenreichii]